MALYDCQGNLLPEAKSVYAGKQVSILGDSISTFAGYVPSGNGVWYTGSNGGVTSVDDIWWKKVLDALGAVLLCNESWSGSRVTTTDGTESAGCRARCEKLDIVGVQPEVILVYMGINDFINDVSLGAYDGTGNFPASANSFREAYAIMLDIILRRYPKAEVWVSTLPYCERKGDKLFPERNGNSITLAAWNNAIRELAALFGVKVLEFAKCGLTYQNLNQFMGDYADGSALHPNAQGHSLLANQAIRQLDPHVRTRYA